LFDDVSSEYTAGSDGQPKSRRGRVTWKTASATNCSSFCVSWCQSLRSYRSAMLVYHSASSGWAALCRSKYCNAAIAPAFRVLPLPLLSNPKKKNSLPAVPLFSPSGNPPSHLEAPRLLHRKRKTTNSPPATDHNTRSVPGPKTRNRTRRGLQHSFTRYPPEYHPDI
jgi:hypothetical protein